VNKLGNRSIRSTVVCLIQTRVAVRLGWPEFGLQGFCAMRQAVNPRGFGTVL